MNKKMHLGAFLHGFGHHQAGWRHESTNLESEFSFQHYLHLTRTAERGSFDLVFLADSAGFRDWDISALKRMPRVAVMEPLTLLSALAVSTEHIGLVATTSTTYNEPYTVARMFASLDVLSGGRIGWNLVTSTSESEAMNYHLASQIEHSKRYMRAEEFHRVVEGLWRSWDADAFVRDKQAGLYFDPERLHTLNHKGDFFSVRGPLNTPPSPQGRPVVVQAGSSEEGKELAARTADAVFTAQPTLENAQKFYADLKGRMSRYGRAQDELKILPGMLPIVGETQADAHRKFEELQTLVHEDIGLNQLKDLFGGFDLSGYDLDGPLPDIPDTEGGKSRRQVLIDMARRESLSIRQLYQRTTAARGFLPLIGTPSFIADEMERWLTQSGCDGFNVMAPVMPRDLTDFVDHVVPELQKRGLMNTGYPEKTLRARLGARMPA
ncbi:LLM class flavin-dependent oxidoreductase [Caballeronia sp. GAFFF2]|uniref:LLM class flavin-dependent oxidoreductase n=1 Tax=Caballeronia sp. GAFFF2 TaxID=2921741 RepID=UPI002029098A